VAIAGVLARLGSGAVVALARLGGFGEELNACRLRPGRLGGPEHRAKVQAVYNDVKARGLTPQTEYHIKTPLGKKSKRFADVAGLDDAGNSVEFHQVGRQTKGRRPVSRERQAIDDIRNATGIDPQFHPYN
jgi:hypothetical protein